MDDMPAILVIDNHTTKEGLAVLIADLEEQNITVDIEKVSYRDDGSLRSIAGQVAFADGQVTFNSKKVRSIIVRKEPGDEGRFGVTVKNAWF